MSFEAVALFDSVTNLGGITKYDWINVSTFSEPGRNMHTSAVSDDDSKTIGNSWEPIKQILDMK